jgi:hypothetical protein
MGAPRFVQPRPASPAGSNASLALWLGIGSIVVCVISLGLLALPALLGGIGALVLGLRGRRHGGGRGGAIAGAIAVVLALLAMVFWIVLVILGGLTLDFLDGLGSIEDWFDLPPEQTPDDPDRRII